MIAISQPSEFRQVSAIIDVDIVPETCRRVRLLKHGSDKPLGFYIRDGTSVRVTPAGLEKVPGIFISRLVPGGLAESTGLLAVNDEVLEVNGIEVAGKSLDQEWLPDGIYIYVFRSYVFGPPGFKDYGSATLRCKI